MYTLLRIRCTLCPKYSDNPKAIKKIFRVTVQMAKQLKESGEPQVSTSDPESRQMIVRNNITEVAYNVQTTVDEKHNLPIDYKVTNTNDSKATGNMLRRAKSILRTNDFTALYDKGYHTGKQRASADVGFMFIAYNLRRIMNIVGKNALKKYLEVLVLLISRIYCPIRFKINPFKAINLLKKNLTSFFERFLNWLKFDQTLLEMEGF